MARKNRKNVKTIIREYFGGDSQLFVLNFAQSIESIPEVNNALNRFSEIFSSIPIYHKIINLKSGDVVYKDDNIASILALKPNPMNNAFQFWTNLIKRLIWDGNAFCLPEFDELSNLKAIHPLPYSHPQYYYSSGCAMVRFLDAPSDSEFFVDELICLSRNTDIRGGNALNIGVYDTVLKALQTQIVNVANPKKVRALLQSKNGVGGLKPRDKKGVMTEVQASFDRNIDGLAYLDNAYAITPINWQENDVNRELMQMVINTVYNCVGINDNIINNKASEIEIESFVKFFIEPLARQIEQEFISKLFTKREIEVGHRIELDTFDLSVATLTAKTALFGVASRQGVMNIDEMREKIGQPPLPGGLGKMYRVSGDTINLAKVDEYQAAQKGVKNPSNGGEDSENQNSDV